VLRNAGYVGRIVSFEPLADARKQLMSLSRKDSLWEIAPQAAIGNEDGEIAINVSRNSVSSSVLNMLDAHASAAPESAYIRCEKVPLRRLDTIAPHYSHPDSVLFIKIDTQGYEDRVLQGGHDLLEKAIGVQLELSLVPLYEGQCLYDEMIARLKSLGFELWGISPEFIDSTNARVLQIDATFFRR
jgi:FkbM family methyltransferase